jgi:hypothetical protein
MLEFGSEISPIGFVFYNFRSLLRRAACTSGFFEPPIDKRIACPYKFSKCSGRSLGRKIWADPFARLQALLWRVAVIAPVAR